jgi:hypothetical protein
MNTRVTVILVLLILTAGAIYGQAFEPLDLAKKIFAEDSLTNIDNFINGEYKGHPNGQNLQKGSITKFTLLGQTINKAVVAMTILDSTGKKGLDTYLHFEKDTCWKMSAFRSLAMTGIIEQVKFELENMTSQQVDELIKKSKKEKNNDYAVFTSRQDYSFQLGNARLTLELDDNIIKHFLANKAEFERIKNVAFKELETIKTDEERSTMLAENMKPAYQKLFISSISFGGYETGNTLNFLIGGMVDNSVGYIYVKDKKDLPQMNSDRIIMIREIGDGWYIYKTT